MSAGELSRNGPEIATKSPQALSLGDFRFDPALPELTNATGAPVDLRNQSLEVLYLLAEQAGKVVAKDDLIATVWGDTFVTDDSLVQCIADIRRAIGDEDHKMVQTLPRRGYRLNPGRATPHLPAFALPDLAGRRAIAVLPFTSLSDDREQTYFAEGLSEDLIARLSMVRKLTVLAAPSRFAFGGDFIRANDAGIDLGPDFLIKGTVRRASDKVRVTVQIVNANSGIVLLSRRYDRQVKDIFEIQDDIAGDIVAETQVVLTEGEVAHLAIRQTRSVQAWEFFHQGLVEHLKYTPEANWAARRLFRKALEVDPDYYDVMVADGWALWLEVRSSLEIDLDDSLRACRVVVDKLIARWPDFPDALHLDAALLMTEGKHDAAQIRAEQARAAGPSFMHGHGIVPLVHLYGGNLQRSLELFRERIQAAPVVTDNALHYYAHCLTLIGDYAPALVLAEEYRRRVPNTVYGYTLLATAQGMAGQVAAAAETIAALRTVHPWFTLAHFLRHEPYRDAETLDRITALLRIAGVPE